jgi:hypothetical protein
MLPTTSYLPRVHYVQLLLVLGYLLLYFCDFFFGVIPTYGALCSISNGAGYLLPNVSYHSLFPLDPALPIPFQALLRNFS